MSEVWIIDAVRSPRGLGKPEGALASLHPQHLFAQMLTALVERTGLDPKDVEDVIAGVNTQQGKQGLDLARMAVLDAGLPENVPGFSLDRFCGSGLTAVSLGAMGILSGAQDVVIAGGCEMMSYTRTQQREFMMDSGNLELRHRIPQVHQGLCADMIATLDGFTRQDLDALALLSQQRTDRAVKEGRYAKSLIPIKDGEGKVLLDHEQYPRPQTTAEILAGLKPAFESAFDRQIDADGTTFGSLVRQVYPELDIQYVHTAATSSGVVDGAGALLLASPDYARAHGLKPRARVRGMAVVGSDPTLMLNGPVPATRKVLEKARMAVDDIDLWEINEAFAVVPAKFTRDLQLDPETVNVNGGAMALGHPIGATGAILTGTVLDELERQDKATGLITMCAAGGLAPAVVIERI
ncbi:MULTISPECIES: acetyl-CoA C-acetyltransferase [unclassified Novosphingobium]|uniref:acetyl-CoA C-acetyltransferase n=1 Tax=unclassified Novosphingobium TaxID=2644732 RepID=UPI000D31A335|nr:MULTISPECIES: acetyl-CoA C-acetyltransferase [unclassified Novosphingobium]PTR12561.1 acetyl-CoA C-acetyltransferase [Novosphingobium sp. GV055]PUB06345.1 acetyl-CoA C-acetyltransferase [Novosphingobium sp. GV061]PUB22396.1 acetyl-CoA C-acetyltransferase [Novosphingobium sp. GV079]PUB44421.1 acetyl-CoA C-acetyltransferase [Novosphingobium sp. GV027]